MTFYMLVLAVDTTTRPGSIALARDLAIIDTFIGDVSATHGERLPGDLLALLRQQGLRVADVDLFAVAAGPGSFTGLRVGIAIQQGLALANDRPLIGVSALDALNEAAGSSTGAVVVWMDAQRGEVFSAAYDGGRIIEPPVVEKPAELLARWATGGRDWLRFIGDGAVAYKELIARAFPRARVDPLVPPLAPSIARLALGEWRSNGPSRPDAIRPIYVRRSDAELARDRRGQVVAPNPDTTTVDKPAS